MKTMKMTLMMTFEHRKKCEVLLLMMKRKRVKLEKQEMRC
jgi:hypothetical protein